MNLAAATNPGKPMPGFAGFMSTTIKTQGFKSLYDGVRSGHCPAASLQLQLQRPAGFFWAPQNNPQAAPPSGQGQG